ncbi:ATP-dependent DNA helicase Q5 [Pyrenophora tritici-repentis]|nr:ATP-dependent DNA helicase Q5 [Pyrenophora tritici-repentis]
MQWMLDLRTYGLKIHYNTTTRGHVEWTNGDELLYKELHFSMAQFRGMLMFSSKAAPVPAVPWESIRDNPTDERPGWNFLKDHRTNMPVNGERWLFERVGESASIRKRYMDRVVEFREKLAVLMHITGGQPARGPELLSVRHSNTVQGASQYIHRGRHGGVCDTVPQGIQSQRRRQDYPSIFAARGGRAGSVVYVAGVAVPAAARGVGVGEGGSFVAYVASRPQRPQVDDRSAAGGVEAREPDRDGPGVDVCRVPGDGDWHQPAVLRGSTAFQADEGEENKEWAEEQAGDSIADEQAGHTSHVAGLVYARGSWSSQGPWRIGGSSSGHRARIGIDFGLPGRLGRPEKKQQAEESAV